MMNAFLTIWTKPMKTARFAIENKSWLYAIMLAVLAGFGLISLQVQGSNLTVAIEPLYLYGLMVVLSPLFGLLYWVTSSAFYYWVGKLLRGTGTFRDVAVAMSVTLIPYIIWIPFIILCLVLSGEFFFIDTTTMLESSSDNGLVIIGSLLYSFTAFIFSVWTLIMSMNAVGAAHRISRWKGLAVMLLSFFLFVSLYLAFVMITSAL